MEEISSASKLINSVTSSSSSLISKNTQKQIVHALKILQAAGDLSGASQLAATAKVLTLGMSCVKFMTTSPQSLVNDIQTGSLDNFNSLQKPLLSAKAAVSYATFLPRLMKACDGVIHPSLQIFPKEVLKELSGANKNAKNLAMIGKIIKADTLLRADKLSYMKITQSAATIGTFVSSAMGWDNAKLVLSVVSHVTGIINVYNASTKEKETVQPEKAPLTNLSNLSKESTDLLIGHFKTIEKSLTAQNDPIDDIDRKMAQAMMGKEILANASFYESALKDVSNEFNLLDIVTAYRNINLPDLVAGGLADTAHVEQVEQLFNQISNRIDALRNLNEEVKATLERTIVEREALLTTATIILSDPTRTDHELELAQSLQQAVQHDLDELVSCQKLWMPDAMHLDTPVLERMTSIDRDKIWVAIGGLSAPQVSASYQWAISLLDVSKSDA